MSKDRTKLTIKAGLFCDDVRAERSGKLIVIGAYAQNIAVPTFPATLVLNCLLILQADDVGETALEYRVLCGDHTFSSGHGRIKFGKGTSLLPVPNLLLQDIKQEGTIVLQVKQNGGNWATVSSIPIEKLRE